MHYPPHCLILYRTQDYCLVGIPCETEPTLTKFLCFRLKFSIKIQQKLKKFNCPFYSNIKNTFNDFSCTTKYLSNHESIILKCRYVCIELSFIENNRINPIVLDAANPGLVLVCLSVQLFTLNNSDVISYEESPINGQKQICERTYADRTGAVRLCQRLLLF